MTHEHMAKIALRYDTAMSRAMLRALGIPVPERRPRRAVIARDSRFDGMDECRRQRHGARV